MYTDILYLEFFTVKEIIQAEIKRFMEKENGLSIIEIPTGRGKTHNILKCIADYREKFPDRNIFFITTQLKNLPYEDLSKHYKDKLKFKQEVMKIERNIASFLAVDFNKIEKSLKDCKDWSEYKELKANVKQYKKIIEDEKQGHISINSYSKIEIENELAESERDFRKRIELMLKSEASALKIPVPDDVDDDFKYKKRYLINSRYEWIKQLYPTVDTDNHKVFMLSMAKFLYGNSTIIEPTYKFINNRITDNAIIFIDEFDSTKQVIDNIIIENTARKFENKIEIFKTIYQKFQIKLPKAYMDTCDGKGVRVTYEVMKNKASELYEKFFSYDSMQLCKEYRDERCNFMLHDGSLHTLGDPSRTYIVAIENKETDKLDIKFLTQAEHNQLEKGSFIHINSLLENLEQYFGEFRGFIRRWAARYSQYAKISEEDAIMSLLGKFGLKDSEAELIMENRLYYIPYNKLEKEYKTLADMIPDTTYYNYGFDIHSYYDSQVHNEDTEIRSFQKHDTPEKFMRYLCAKANVIGVSATAMVPTFDNYNISYLADIIREKFTLVSEDNLQVIKQKEESLAAEYKEKGIEIITSIMRSADLYSQKPDKTKAVYEMLNYLPEEEAEVLARKLLAAAGKNEYNLTRYLDVIKAMYDFWNDKGSHAWLFLNWPLLKQTGDFDEEIIRHAFERIVSATNIDVEYAKDTIVILKSSESFEDEKQRLSDDISAGKKRMVFSSYQTLMAGQNLNFNYSPDAIKDYVMVGKVSASDKRYLSADYDGIVLGDITHQNYNKTFGDKKPFERNLERVTLATKIQDTYENDYLEKREQDALLKYALRDTKDKDFEPVLNKANNCPLARNKTLQIIMQSLGRITRTFVKNKKIKIYINNKVLCNLDKEELSKHILTPELSAIYSICPGVAPIETDTLTLRAIKNCSRANRWINSLMKKENGSWEQENMQMWKQTRIDVLSKPLSACEHRFSGLYFETDNNATKYYFAQKNDFGTVRIDFRNTKTDFIRLNNLKDFISESGYGVQEMSEDNCRLQKILKYPGMMDYFKKKGFATSFEPKKFIIAPVVYQNIYKGALGEEAGKFILEDRLDIKLKEIDDASKFELFDFVMADGVYVDFKHWRPYYYSDRKKMFEKISRKLDECGGKRVYVINILADGFLKPDDTKDERIIVIPNLLNEEDSSINISAIKAIHPEDYEINGGVQ